MPTEYATSYGKWKPDLDWIQNQILISYDAVTEVIEDEEDEWTILSYRRLSLEEQKSIVSKIPKDTIVYFELQ